MLPKLYHQLFIFSNKILSFVPVKICVKQKFQRVNTNYFYILFVT